MSEYLIDTNVLLDVIGADEQFGERSRLLLEQLSEQGVLIINPVIYAEVGAMCDSLEELNELLPESLFRHDVIPWEAHFLAGQAFRRYRHNKGQQKRVLADFLIAAHAAYSGYTLVSRDSGHKRYFNMELLNPAVQAVP